MSAPLRNSRKGDCIWCRSVRTASRRFASMGECTLSTIDVRIAMVNSWLAISKGFTCFAHFMRGFSMSVTGARFFPKALRLPVFPFARAGAGC